MAGAHLTISELGGDDPAGIAAASALFDGYRVHYGQVPRPAASARWLAEQLRGGLLRMFVVDDEPVPGDPGEEPAGGACGFVTITVIPASLALGVWWQIRDLWVAPPARRRGVATALLAHVARTAAAAGALRVGLQTEVDNEPALALYGSLGFTAVTGLRQLTLDTRPADEPG